MKTATHGLRQVTERLILAAAGVSDLIALELGLAAESRVDDTRIDLLDPKFLFAPL